MAVDTSGIAADNPSYDHLYRHEDTRRRPEHRNSQVVEFDSSGNQVGGPIGSGLFPRQI